MQSPVEEHYAVELPNDKAPAYRVVTFIIALINIAAFTWSYFNETDQAKLVLSVTGVVLSAAALLFFILKNKNFALQSFRIEIAFIILAVVWMASGNLWLGLPLLIFAAFGFYTNKKTILNFSHKGILYPSFPPKLLLWSEVDFVILKDGILTMEMSDNRVFQFTLSHQETAKLDEHSFNEFCSRLIAKPVKG
jgi:hypothetical protein